MSLLPFFCILCHTLRGFALFLFDYVILFNLLILFFNFIFINEDHYFKPTSKEKKKEKILLEHKYVRIFK